MRTGVGLPSWLRRASSLKKRGRSAAPTRCAPSPGIGRGRRAAPDPSERLGITCRSEDGRLGRQLLPAPRRAEEVLPVPAECRRGGQEWVDGEVADEAARVPAGVDVEASEHMSFLPPAEKAEDREREG